MLPWIYYACLILLQITGLMLAILGLPGIWLMVAAVGGYAWLTVWNQYVGWPALLTVFVLAVLSEIVEFVAGAAGSAKAGGSKRGIVGALVGGFVGAIVLTPFIPIPVVGTVAGACIGSFAGAFLVEVGIGREMRHSANIGWGAAKGRLWGIASKLAFGVIILIVTVITAIPW
jgi:uncharacterized protein